MFVKPDVSLPARTVWQQNDLDCCMSCALVTCVEALHGDWPALAPLFHYYHSRRSPDLLEGLDELQAFSGASRAGFATLSLHDHDFTSDGARQAPSAAADADGKNRLFLSFVGTWIAPYKSVFVGDREFLWRNELSSGNPIYLGLQLDDTYNKLGNSSERPVWQMNGSGQPGAYHAVAILGYTDQDQYFIVQDSRGDAFGAGGQWFLPYRTVQSPLIRFAYAIGG